METQFKKQKDVEETKVDDLRWSFICLMCCQNNALSFSPAVPKQLSGLAFLRHENQMRTK